MHKKNIQAIIWSLIKHGILILFSAIAVFPVIVVVLNSFKKRVAIFSNPYTFPGKDTFDIIGYRTVFTRSNFPLYYVNSLIIVGISLFIILFLGSMVAFALSEYKFKLNGFFTVFFLLGIIIPIRLASVSILEIMLFLKLTNTHTSLILVYCAQGMPLAILILTKFMNDVPRAIKESARVEGANEFYIYLLTLPLTRQAVATVGAFAIIPIWNDIWFPLILAPGESVCTVTMGAQKFLGQFANDWNALLAALSMSIVPILIFYFVFSKNILRGIVDGAVK
jgi:raffinose/stachyose/melibiose transport system permease protein